MFIIDLVLGAMQLAAVGAGGLWVYKDYRSGFLGTKAIANKVRGALGLGGKTSESERAALIVQNYVKGVGQLREAVAMIEANYEIAGKKAKEQYLVADRFENIKEEAMRKGDEKTVAAAAKGKLEAKKRADLNRGLASEQVEIAQALHAELEARETDLDVVRTEAETVVVFEAIDTARRHLYQLISRVDAVSGLTVRGELEAIRERSERKMLQSGHLVKMAQNHGGDRLNQLLQLSEVKDDIEETRRRISLPPAPKEVEAEAIEAEVVAENNGYVASRAALVR